MVCTLIPAVGSESISATPMAVKDLKFFIMLVLIDCQVMFLCKGNMETAMGRGDIMENVGGFCVMMQVSPGFAWQLGKC